MKKWSYNNIADQSGRFAIVTGANSGLGFQVSLTLAKKGAEVIMACRNRDKALKAEADIYAECPEAKLHLLELDLSDLNSVKECVEKIKTKYNHLDLIINNAGVMVPPFSRTKQGFELQFGTNHLAHFAMVGQLLPLIKNVENSRIVSVSSIAAEMNYIDFNDLNFENKKYRKWKAYSQSKLANQMFMLELAEKLRNSGSKTISVAAHPGVSSTNLFNTAGFLGRKGILSMISQSPEFGALSILRAACDSEVYNGSYWGPSGVFGMKGTPREAKLVSKARKELLVKKLWDVSEELTSVKYADFL